jgi:hypothetical protein
MDQAPPVKIKPQVQGKVRLPAQETATTSTQHSTRSNSTLGRSNFTAYM